MNRYEKALIDTKVPYIKYYMFSGFHGNAYRFPVKYLKRVDREIAKFDEFMVYQHEVIDGVKMKGFTLYN